MHVSPSIPQGAPPPAIVPMPAMNIPGLPSLGGADDDPTCTFQRVKTAFGIAASDTRTADFLSGLIASMRFPAPLPRPRHGGGIETGVTAKSCWLREAVRAWFAAYMPPAAATALHGEALRDAAADLDAKAGQLAGPLFLATKDGNRCDA